MTPQDLYLYSYIHRIVTNLWMLYVSYYIRTVYIINVSNDASPIGIGSTMKRIVEWGKSSMCQTAISNQPLSAILKISSYTKRLMPGLLSCVMYICTLWVLSAISILGEGEVNPSKNNCEIRQKQYVPNSHFKATTHLPSKIIKIIY